MKYSFWLVEEDQRLSAKEWGLVQHLKEAGLVHQQFINSELACFGIQEMRYLFVSEEKIPENEAVWLINAFLEKDEYEEGCYDDIDEWDFVEERDLWGIVKQEEKEEFILFEFVNKNIHEYIKNPYN